MRLDQPSKASPSRCPPTATPPSWAGPMTIPAPGRCGCGPGAVMPGPSRAASWSPPARPGKPIKASRSRCPPTATPPSSAGLPTRGYRGGVGLYTQRQCLEPAGRQAGRHRRGRTRSARLLRRAVPRRQHHRPGRARGQCGHRGGLGLYPQRRCLGPAGQQAGRHRGGRTRRSGLLRRAVPRRQHHDDGRVSRPGFRRGGVGAAATPGPSRATSWSASGSDAATKGFPSRCPATATPPSWAAPPTTTFGARRGSTSAGPTPGTCSATSSSAPARWDPPDRAWRSPCPPAATPRSWVGGSTMAASGRRGCSRRRPCHRAGDKERRPGHQIRAAGDRYRPAHGSDRRPFAMASGSLTPDRAGNLTPRGLTETARRTPVPKASTRSCGNAAIKWVGPCPSARCWRRRYHTAGTRRDGRRGKRPCRRNSRAPDRRVR
jgi:hypothetical protein